MTCNMMRGSTHSLPFEVKRVGKAIYQNFSLASLSYLYCNHPQRAYSCNSVFDTLLELPYAM